MFKVAEVEDALLHVGSREGCSVLEKDANALGDKIIEKYQKLQKQYDISTNHGITTGAVFP